MKHTVKRLFAAILAAMMLLCLLSGCSGGVSSVQDARQGVVRILTKTKDDLYYVASAVGVGKAGEAPTFFVTNHHAVSDDDGNVVANIYILKDSHAIPVTEDGLIDVGHMDFSRMVPCDVVYRAPNGSPDLAVIRAADPVEGRIALPIAKAEDTLESGDTVYALGYPGSADLTAYKEMGGGLPGSVEDITVTNGVVSRIAEFGPMGNTPIIQHTASINHGNSGGALVNEKGALVGINAMSFNADGMDNGQNHYLAIESEVVIDMLDDLNIQYTLAGFPIWIVIAILAAVVVVVIVVVLVTRKKSPVAETKPGNETVIEPPKPEPQPVSAGFRIQGISGKFANRRFAVNGNLRIGRDPARNDLVYPADTKGISGVHCVLTVNGSRLILQDLGSTYGTYVAGNRIAASQTMELHKGDRFWLGSESEAFVVDYKG